MSKSKRILSFVLATVMALLPSAGALAATTVGNNVSVGGTLGVTGASTVAAITASGLSTMTGGFISSASSSVGAGLQVAGNLSVSSTLTLGGNILPDGNSTRSVGAFGLALNNVYVSGTVFGPTNGLILANGFISNASSSIAGGLNVNGALNASSSLLATGLSSLIGGFVSNASSSVGGGLFTAGNGLLVTGATAVSSTLNLGGNIIPDGNNTRGIGAYGTALANVYSSGTVFSATTTIFNASVASSTLFINSTSTASGGQIVLKASDGSCYSIFIGVFNNGLKGVTSSLMAACPSL